MTSAPQLNQRIKIAFIVNPIAGMGGPSALKGSDLIDVSVLQENQITRSHACSRAARFLSHIFDAFSDMFSNDGTHKTPAFEAFDLVLARGVMGSNVLSELDVPRDIAIHILNIETSFPSSSSDTKKVVREMNKLNVDLIVFVGGDGTARDVYDALGCTRLTQLVLGIPAGVKMHSGVFAIDSVAASIIVKKLLSRELVSTSYTEVRDIDEELLRQGKVNAKFYGELLTPSEHDYLQAVKQGGVEVEELVLLDLVEEIRLRLSDYMEQDLLLICAPGSTVHFIMSELGLNTTLLGFDLVLQQAGELKLLAADLNRDDLMKHVVAHDGPMRMLITPIGGQGHIIGRGNQQLSAELLNIIQRQNLWLLATKAKLESLNHRPLLIDSDNETLDRDWSGFIPVITGLNDEVVYRVGYLEH